MRHSGTAACLEPSAGRLASSEVGVKTFRDCTALTSISLSGVTRIKDNAFHGSIRLAKISGMGAVHTIMANAFKGTTALQGPLYLATGTTV